MTLLKLDGADLRPLIEKVVTEVIDRLEADRANLNGQIGYPEPEAAALLGIRPHVLRDARLRGEIHASKIGKRVIYEKSELERFLRAQRCNRGQMKNPDAAARRGQKEGVAWILAWYPTVGNRPERSTWRRWPSRSTTPTRSANGR